MAKKTSIPARYQTRRAQIRVFDATSKRLRERWPDRKVPIEFFEQYFSYSIELIERAVGGDAALFPPRNQWSRPIVAVLEASFVLERQELRLKFLKAASLAVRLIPWLDEEFLRACAVDRVIAYVAVRSGRRVLDLDGLFFVAARNYFRDLLAKDQNERAAATEMYRRIAERKTDDERRGGLDASRNQIRRALIPFVAQKCRQQRRSSRTRRLASQRTRGFALAILLMLTCPRLSRDECRVDAERRAAAINKRKGNIEILVPPRATFHAWLRELIDRIKDGDRI